ncbi:MAG: sulfatase-like hydrolase/transferase [Rikenellaceae bacterium]
MNLKFANNSCILLTLGALAGCVSEDISPDSNGGSGVNGAVDYLANSRYNIIFIFADDWGWGDLACHGHDVILTPNIDKLASEGIDFKAFNVGSPVSSASRTAVMTGNFPSRHGMHQHLAGANKNAAKQMPNYLDNTVTLLPKLLQSAGYKTAHYGKWHLGNISSAPEPMTYGYDDTRVYNGNGPNLDTGPTGYVTSEYTAQSVDATIAFITEHKYEPFFVNLWIHETHQDIEPLDEEREVYADIADPEQSYYSVVTAADKHIGRLMQALKDEGLDDNTLVIFSSDNGPETATSNSLKLSVGDTGGLKGRKRSLFEGGVKVPFIVRLPGVVPAGVVDDSTLLATVDLLPTFCSIAGVSLPEDYLPDGENISLALLGEDFTREKAMLHFWPGDDDESLNLWPRLGAKDNKYKVLINYDMSRVELYDYKNDWGEENNLAEGFVDSLSEHKYTSKIMELTDLAYEYFYSLDYVL